MMKFYIPRRMYHMKLHVFGHDAHKSDAGISTS